MPFNVLLLPLLGGYVFISNFNRTRFDAKRYSGERLIFHAAIAGAVFLLIAFIGTRVIILREPDLYDRWRALVPFEYTGTSLSAFVLGIISWWPLNLLFKKDREAVRAVENWGDFLELLLNRSMTNTEQLSISLASGKAYIGFVTSSFDPAFDRKYMLLLPTLSGYREHDTRELVVTHDYAEVYQQLIDKDASELFAIADEFQLVIPVSEIVTASLFDPKVYELFESAPTP